jgi:hypothetical protein
MRRRRLSSTSLSGAGDRPRRAIAALPLTLPTLLLLAACGGTGSTGGSGGTTGGSADAGTTTISHPDDAPLSGQSACTVVEDVDIPEPDFNHLTLCTEVDYATNPPSGGNHWPVWAAFKIYDVPVPRELYVHDLEHGAIVLTYNCPDGCPDVVTALTTVFNDMPADSECAGPPSGPSARMVLTPDPLLATPIGASAWGATYTATCIDLPSLKAFAKAHYNHGREDFCTDGVDVSSATSSCSDAGADGGS